jgi:hypothetical protein
MGWRIGLGWTLLLVGCTQGGADDRAPADAPSGAAAEPRPSDDNAADPESLEGRDCSDGHGCTIDELSETGCVSRIGPNSGVTACPQGLYCTLEAGCVNAPACANDEDCAQAWSADPCKDSPLCDASTSVCQFRLLDKDGDGHAPPVCGGADCDDSARAMNPNAAETCNGTDDDCDGTIDEQAECEDPNTICLEGACVCRPELVCGSDCAPDFDTDPLHCGDCDTACPLDGICTGGVCGCPSNLSFCESGSRGRCVDLIVDWGNCGECGNVCPASRSTTECAAGVCACIDGGDLCGEECFDLQSDITHCGACDVQCAVGEFCVSGACFPGSPVLAVSTGFQHTCAVTTSGAVFCWGGNVGGILGDGTTEERAAPTAVKGARRNFVAVSAGYGNTCAVKDDGSVWCWGGTFYEPFQIAGDFEGSVQSIGVGLQAAAVDAEGTLWTWPVDENPQEAENAPTALDTGFVAVFAGRLHSCATKPDGSLWCWGRNEFGQLGDGTDYDSSRPVAVLGLPGETRSAGPGSGLTCALETDGTVWCWGGSDSPAPVQMESLGANVTQLGVGETHQCAVKDDGSVWCWGSGDDRQLGNASFDNSAEPVRAQVEEDVSFVAAGGAHACAITVSGRLWCWGQNTRGQVGKGRAGYTSDPVLVPIPPP